MTTTATYTKLRDGSWGIRAPFPVTAGQAITVTKKSGESKTEKISRVLWSGDGITFCAIVKLTSGAAGTYRRSSGRRSGRYECEECGDMVESGTSCWETGMQH